MAEKREDYGAEKTIDSLLEENEQLKARVEELERELEMRPHGRRKGSGSHYDILKLSSIHRKILYTLLEAGAVSEERGTPAVELRRRLHMGQGPLSGRVAELIHKNYVVSSKVRISFQPIGGTLMYRPETEIDPNLGVKRYRRFVYHITPEGVEALKRAVLPTDDFMRGAGQIEVLAELRKAAEAKQGG